MSSLAPKAARGEEGQLAGYSRGYLEWSQGRSTSAQAAILGAVTGKGIMKLTQATDIASMLFLNLPDEVFVMGARHHRTRDFEFKSVQTKTTSVLG